MDAKRRCAALVERQTRYVMLIKTAGNETVSIVDALITGSIFRRAMTSRRIPK